MKSILTCLCVLALSTQVFAYNTIWKAYTATTVPTHGIQQLHPSKYLVYSLDANILKPALALAGKTPDGGVLMELPVPDGSFRSFKVWETSNMDPTLAAKYPEIKSYSAFATDDASVTAKLDMSPRGFGAMVYDKDNTYLIDPYSNTNDGFYLCYYKHDYARPANKTLQCNVGMDKEKEEELHLQQMNINNPGGHLPALQINGAQKHNYRLALACEGEYAVAVGGATPTKPIVLAAMNTSLNRVNGVYEKELSIHMDLIANDDQLIFLDPTTDPYHNSCQNDMLTENQTTISTIIGDANYDIGHVFGGCIGGIADLSSVCTSTAKARGLTGQTTPVGDAFDIDYVVHEMGHQFGATHTFNANTEACGGNNAFMNTAYEPGGGSTIMAYAGICGVDDNISAHSDDYFHAASLEQIADYTILNTGSTCGTLAPSGNTPNLLPGFSNTYYIPFLTPFELTGPQATDIEADPITYCWEEWDLGDFKKSFPQTEVGPIFRSFKPVSSEARVFLTLDKVRANYSYYLGEKLPDIERILTFRLTSRDIHNGWGAFNAPSDRVTVHAMNTTTPFALIQPNTAADYWQVGSTQTVTWNVSNTTAPPISCANVDIFLSMDDGQTYPFTLATGVPNNGSATITVPVDAYTASARVKVKGANNVFFDLSNTGFIINNWPASVKNVSWANDLSVYPVPANDAVHIHMSNSKNYSINILNVLGQQVFESPLKNEVDINVSNWTKDIYYLQLTDKATNEKLVKRIVVD